MFNSRLSSSNKIKNKLSFLDILYAPINCYILERINQGFMTKIRKFASVEQALSYILKELDGDEILQATSKSVDYFRKCSDEDSREQINQKDAIELDIASARKGHGFPILNAHTALVENAVKSSDNVENIASVLIGIGGRLGDLMDEAKKAIDPDGHGGSSITAIEKEKIDKAIKEVEANIVNLKLSVGID
tara:strand:- start:70 stop:642 length:573 start_codon:yes stop_codon:yes gene_type:complete